METRKRLILGVFSALVTVLISHSACEGFQKGKRSSRRQLVGYNSRM